MSTSDATSDSAAALPLGAAGWPRLGSVTPVMIVDAVEPCVAFWVDRFGLRVEHEVPGPDGRLAFASVTNGAVELMYQTRDSVLADMLAGEVGRARTDQERDLDGHSAALFFHVDDLDAVERAVAGAPVVQPRRATFYGTVELYVREPGGAVVGFAAPAGPSDAAGGVP